jgi:hypothetical protein
MSFHTIALILLAVVYFGHTTADPLPMSRRIDWNPGIPGGIPTILAVSDVKSYGATGDGKADDAGAFQAAIDDTPAGAILIPKGTYRLRSGLTIGKSIVLRGEGVDRTKLIFDIADRVAIAIVTYRRGEWTAITSGYTSGSTKITVRDGRLFKEGDFAEIQQDNDPELMYSDDRWIQTWSEDSVGQILRIRSINRNELTLDQPLNVSYGKSFNPRIRSQGFVTHAGIEDLSLVLTDRGDPTTIQIKNAAYCWVRNVKSSFTSRVHVSLTAAYRCVVRDSYFADSYEFGGGGHGYGVDCRERSSNCLIENNVFRHLRHSMLVQVGATGNVFGYNYSIDPNSEGTWTPCDISLHGHYPNMNLFEGNTIQEIDVSDYWGPVGPGNTFLRNTVESEGIEVMDHSHGQNIVGNQLGTGKNRIVIHESVDGTYLYGNKPDSEDSDTDIPASYYLSEKPAFFGEATWPLSPANPGLPSRLRYQEEITNPE